MSTASITLLVDRLAHLLTLATNTLADNLKPAVSNAELVQRWYDQVASQLARYHIGAFLVGKGATEITPEEQHLITGDIATQLDFLRNFATVIEQSQGEFQQGWRSRAQSYAGAIKTPYWRGETKMLPLPAMPAQGTQCHNNCGCSWDIQQLDGDGNYNCFWRRGKSDSCQVCIQREHDWSPLRVRNGEVQ